MPSSPVPAPQGPPWRLRPAGPADAAAIARAHALARREAYQGLLPPEAVDPPSLAQRELAWAARLGDPRRHGLLGVHLGEIDGVVVGFASFGPQRAPELVALGLGGEIHALYVLRRAQRTGLGSALLAAARSAMATAGLPGTGLWTFAHNRAARAFYERCGGRRVADARPVEVAGRSLEELAYGWPAGPSASGPAR